MSYKSIAEKATERRINRYPGDDNLDFLDALDSCFLVEAENYGFHLEVI